MTEYTTRPLDLDESRALVRKITVKLGSNTLALQALQVVADFGAGIFMTTEVEPEEQPLNVAPPVRKIEETSEVIHGFVFVPSGYDYTDTWVASGPDGEKLFELSRQDYVSTDDDDEGVDDWGVYDIVGDDWAHYPLETGFQTKQHAIESFGRWLKENN